ncbi:MAG: DUF72 domain-containing protein [Longimicrobiales bacterium]|nr:DUF72 domain-containing protein [Longimicrobiales bacterium]
MDLRTGTSGFSYKAWKGSFYPEDLSSEDMLGYYGERLGAVEINNTFYRLPKASTLEGWAAQVPDHFRFSIKASRKITHFSRLKESARDPTSYLLSTVETLGERLGALLFQLPPNFKKDVARLESFVEMIPEGRPAAFEFRHDSWADEEVREILERHDIALVCADTEDAEEDEPIVATTSWGYLRLRRPGYDDDDLKRWVDRVRSTGWDRALVFFKHEDEGAGPRMAGRFRELFDA